MQEEEIKDESNKENQEKTEPYTPANRKKMYIELAQDKEKHEREKHPDKFKEPKAPS